MENLTVEEAARRLGRDVEMVRRWIREGRLKADRVGSMYVVRPAELRRFRVPKPRPRAVEWIRVAPEWQWHALRDPSDSRRGELAACGAWLAGAGIEPSNWSTRKQRPRQDACEACTRSLAESGRQLVIGASPENDSQPLGSAGGAAAASGSIYQASVIAFVGVHILAKHRLAWLDPHDDTPVAVLAETAGAGDDARIEFGARLAAAEVQIKRGLEGGAKLDATVGAIRDRSRPGDESALILVVDRTSSGAVRQELARDLERLRTDRLDDLGTQAKRLRRMLGADAGLLDRLRVVECDVDSIGGRDTSLALHLLKSVLSNPGEAPAAWKALVADAAQLSSRRLARTRTDLIAVLNGLSITLKPQSPNDKWHQQLDGSKRLLERGQATGVLSLLDQLERDLRGTDHEPLVDHRLAQQRAVALFRLSRFGEALSSARRALEIDAKGLHALTIAARAAMYAADLRTAKSYAKQATQNHPHDPEAWGVLAEVSAAADEPPAEPPGTIARDPRYREFLCHIAASRQDWNRVAELTTELLQEGRRTVDVLAFRSMSLLNTTAGGDEAVTRQHCDDVDRLATEMIDLLADDTNPASAMALTWRSTARRLLGRVAEADADLEEARRRHPDDPEAIRLAATARMEANDSLGALQILRQSTADRESLLLAMRAGVLVQLGEKMAARRDLDEAVRAMGPRDSDHARIIAANAALELADLELAKRLEADVHEPRSATADRLRGRIAFHEGRFEDGAERFHAAAQEDPSEAAQTLAELAIRLDRAKLHDRALATFNLVDVESLPVDALSACAAAHFRAQNLVAAQAVVERTLRTTPVPSWALELATNIALRQEDVPAAIRHLTTLVSQGEATPHARIALARCLLETEQHDDARLQVERLLTEPQLDPDDQMQLAGLALAIGRPEDALRIGFRAYRRAPQDPQLHRGLATLLLVGRPEVPDVESVGPETHVTLQTTDGKRRDWTVFADEPVDPLRGELRVEEAERKGLIGKRKGDVVVEPGAWPMAERWTVEDVIPAVVHAARDIVARYEERFPTQPFFVKGFHIGDGDEVKDLAPVIATVQRRKEHADEVLGLVHTQTLPLGFATKLLGGSIADVMAALRSQAATQPLFVEWADAHGQDESRLAVDEAKTVILTRSALETARQLNLLPSLSSAFELVAPRVLERSLREERERAEQGLKEGEKTIVAYGPGLAFDEAEPGAPRLQAKASSVGALHGWVRSAVRLEPRPLSSVAAAGSRDDEERESVGRESYDALTLAHELNATLYADDLGLRRLARGMKIRSFSTISLLPSLSRRGSISSDERDRHLVALAVQKFALIVPTQAILQSALAMSLPRADLDTVFGLLGTGSVLTPADASRTAALVIRQAALSPVRTSSTAEIAQLAIRGMSRAWPARLCANLLQQATEEHLRFLLHEVAAIREVCRRYAV